MAVGLSLIVLIWRPVKLTDVNSFSGYNGKYVLFSAPHTDWASFPNTADIAGLINNTGVPAIAPATPIPTLAPANH